MNHVEALKVCRDALKGIFLRGYNDCDAKKASEAFTATAVIDPVTASIESGKYFDLLANFVTFEIELHRIGVGIHEAAAASLALVQHIDQHCAAQVAQALAAKPAPSDMEISSIAGIELLGRDDAAVHAFLCLRQRDDLEWPDVLAQLALHLVKEKARLTEMLVERISIEAPCFVIAAKPALTDAEIEAVASSIRPSRSDQGWPHWDFYESDLPKFARALLALKPAPDPAAWLSATQAVMPDGSVRALPGPEPTPTLTRNEAHAMVRTGRPAADLIREAFAAGATYRAKIDAAPPTDS